ncbi:MAG: TonB-dependent receptor [Bacteroidota bacterium]
MKLVTMLILCGTFLPFAAASMTDDGIVSTNDLQQRRITGRITDAAGEALAGVNILEKGTLNGAISDANGNYTIAVASANSVLTFSFIGYLTQEVTVGDQNTINIVLVEAIAALDEIVVVGYSTQARKSLTGAVSTISAESLSENTSSSVAVRLQGTASGVSILNTHTPGGDATIRIRGMGTINDSNPLWVVDGVPGGVVSPNDIETISILKDAAASAIYGARAANGVILVTTKSGKRNQAAQVTVNVRQGMTQNTNYYDLLNTQEYGEMLWLEAKNAGVVGYSSPLYGSGATPDIPKYIRPARATSVDLSLYDNKMIHEDGDDTYLIMEASVPGTEWLKEIDRNAKYKEYTVDVAGGSANTVYAFQAGYLLEEGILKYTSFDRYNFRSNITTTTPAKWIEIGEKIGISFSTDMGTQGDNSESTMISQAYRMQPIVPVYDVMGNYAGTRAEGTGNGRNPLFQLDANQHDFTKDMRISGNTYVKLNLLEGLSIRSLVGINYRARHSKDYGFVEVAFSERGKYPSLSEGADFDLQWSWTNTIEYSKTFAGVHDLKVILGSEAVDNNGWDFGARRENFFSQEINYMQINTGLEGINNDGAQDSWSLFSLFGRFNYTYSDKYMLEGVVRRDGSSRFGADNAYGIFPAFSAGWRISNEDFMASTSSWLDELKLRAGYGTIGNDRMGNYNTYTNFSISSSNSFYPINGSNSTTGATGFYQSSFGNPDVKWETTKTTNIGIDAALINKFSLTFDLWQRVTSDMLYPREIPRVLGSASAPSVNVGEMKNTGFDIELGYVNTALNGDLRYSIDMQVSHYKNEIVKLSDKEDEFMSGGNFREMIYSRSETGHAFPEFYGYIVDGIFQTQAEVDAHAPAFGATGKYNKPGNWIYRDVNNDGVVDADDRTYIGSPHPDFTAGLSINVSYKELTLTTHLYASVGNDMMNYVSRWIDFVNFQGGRSHSRLYESWGSPYLSDNSKATQPLAVNNDIDSQQPSTAFVEDGSYLRMKTLRLSYNLSNVLGSKVRNLQVYGQVSNLFTLTKYSGLDPEVGGGGINMGIDAGAWPTPRQIMFGITLGL